MRSSQGGKHPCLDGGCGRVKLWRKVVHRKHHQAKLLCHQFTANANGYLWSQQRTEIRLCLPWQVMDCNRSRPLEDKAFPEELASPLCSVERIVQQTSSGLAQLVRRCGCKHMRSQLDLFHWKLSSLVNSVMLFWSEQTAESGHNRRLPFRSSLTAAGFPLLH